ncbi:MAG TPA: AmmeMemoRadiSam system protein B [Usitatibacter sp.]|nr:AmmeMemoRadiSam system protein B [Usitatibacter sp.]
MGTPSTRDVRGQRDTVGYAVTREAMARVWELSAQGPRPESFGEKVAPGVLGVIGPHDDYIYTARVYREIFPLVTAKTVVMVGVFHRYRKFEARDQLVFDAYRAWSSPDGEVPVSPLRDELVAALPPGMAVKDNAAHDDEHSLEGIAYFMKHARPDIEIVPVIIPAASFDRLSEMAARLAEALAGAMKKRGLELGRDVAIVISADGTHYGDDFRFAPYGAGGREAFDKSVADDRRLMRETLGGLVSAEKARAFYATVVDPANPDQYRRTWCGRFSVTLGTMLVGETAKRMGLAAPRTVPVALGVSVDAPELAVRDVGVAPTAPANLHHFVMHPALAFTSSSPQPGPE